MGQEGEEYCAGINLTKGLVAQELAASMAESIESLTADIALLGDAFKNRAICDWRSIRSIVSDLTDSIEVSKIVNEVVPESKFHNNTDAVAQLLNCLQHCVSEGLVTERDSARNAFNELRDRLGENIVIIEGM